MASKTAVPAIDIDKVLNQVLPVKLIQIFRDCGNVTAARAAAEHLERLQDQLALEQHRERIEGLTDDPLELARYYGRLEMKKRDLRQALGGVWQDEYHEAYERGRLERISEIRALELDRARRGQSIQPWMTRS